MVCINNDLKQPPFWFVCVRYQKKIGTYDRQKWETTVEQKILYGLTHVQMKSTKPNTDFIDLDLVRGKIGSNFILFTFSANSNGFCKSFLPNPQVKQFSGGASTSHSNKELSYYVNK